MSGIENLFVAIPRCHREAEGRGEPGIQLEEESRSG
jgi:hypothetical protein